MVVVSYFKFYFLVIIPKDLYFLLEYVIEVAVIFHIIVYIKFYNIDSKFVVGGIRCFNRSSSGPLIKNYKFRSSILLLLLE
jgi:hypothetical protein